MANYTGSFLWPDNELTQYAEFQTIKRNKFIIAYIQALLFRNQKHTRNIPK